MIGTILGSRYQLIEKIGEGGMAVVFKAKCLLLNRYVAVKILKEEYSNNFEFMNKFRKEAAAAASFSSSSIVNIYDVGSDNNINYIVMELVNGKTLKEVIQERGRLSVEDTLSIGIQIAKALECAHKNNIIHRDIKPHNILVTEDGTVKVTDFGIAKAASSDTITHTSKVIGSAHYFSPEQAKGKIVDYRTDIYSLGIVLYEMVTGKVPFDGDSAVSVALKHIQEPLISPKLIISNIPESLNNLIIKATEKDPIRRYQTATDILNDLKKIQSNYAYTIINSKNENEFTRVMDPIDSKAAASNYNEEPNEDEESPVSSKKKARIDSGKRKWIIASVVVILAIVLGLFAGKFFNSLVTNSGSSDEVKVPTIMGTAKGEAQKAVEDLELKFVILSEDKSDKPKDTIIQVFPNEGSIVKKNSEVRVRVSSGPEELELPDLTALDKNVAQDYIVNLGLKVGKITEENSEDIMQGAVIKSDPQPKTKVKEGDVVNLVISKGSSVKYTNVPDLTNINISDANQVLSVSNLKLGDATSVLTDDKSKDGKIFNQSIAPNTKVQEQQVISVNYYKYEDPDVGKITVPNFIGKTVKDAEETAKKLGLNLQINGDDKGIVENQDKPANTKVERGTTINLTTTPKKSEGGAD
ncbi:Stk1 family PASTA domain-containing Ser/Thr kinase [Clostridium sp.]|uniref:Stk1 family PASTA domain-containing Ser/Thr kinase n=1 Tax=Clostridium sp. TaxID=1506 RepID=UPI002FCC402B